MNMKETNSAKRILVCEDEAALRADIVAVLCEAGYVVSEAADGRAAQILLETVSPDLILCDISMPGLSGLELLSHVRTMRPDLGEVPFLFLTALAERGQVIAGKQAGADDYLVKPIDYEVMLATVSAHLRQVARLRTSLEDNAAQTRHALHEARSLSAFSALDSLAPAIALLDAAGNVVHVNAAAAALFDASGDKFCQRLGLKVPAAIARVRTATDSEEQAIVLRLPRQQDEEDLIVLLSLLPTPEATADAAIMALVIDPSRRTAPTDTLLRSAFGLTPTEARVASLLAQGDRLEEIALGLNVQQSTIIFHLRNIFAKTGTNRQTDLVALLLSLTVAQTC